MSKEAQCEVVEGSSDESGTGRPRLEAVERSKKLGDLCQPVA